jgi:meso-butanediol dehydrogenase/(S,S)-butanediol dehydrogenase/diacetyl reductase
MRLKDKVAVVTGGGSGIGHHACLQMAKEGARVLVVDLVGDRAKQVAQEIKDTGGVAEPLTADISEEAGAKSVAAKAESLWNRLDVLVNNAASFHHVSTEEATADDYEKVFKVNIYGTSFCVKYSLPIMKRQKSGSIINIASINGLVGMGPDWVNYSASKAALVNMTKTMAKDFVQYNIRVNCICPGMIHTPAMEDLLKRMGVTRKEAEQKFLGPRCLLGRFGESYELAPFIVLLASDESSYSTGSTVVVDGGYTS